MSDFDLFDDAPMPTPPKKVEPKPAAAPEAESHSSKTVSSQSQVDEWDWTPSTEMEDILTDQGESTDALLNKETQERIDRAKAQAKETAGRWVSNSLRIASTLGTATTSAVASTSKVAAHGAGKALSLRPSKRVVIGVGAVAVAAALVYGAIRFWPESHESPAPSAPTVKPVTDEPKTAPTPEPIQAPVMDPADVLASELGAAPKQPEPAAASEPQESKPQEPEPVESKAEAKPKTETPKPAAVKPAAKPTTKKEPATNDWQDKANNDMDRFFQNLDQPKKE